MRSDPVKVIAFYLPQFHPIPENDAWWGTGFTEWTNVRKAKPLFPGHYQPRIPGRLGYYDLRDPVVRQSQAELARKFGIEGFCYWHYWMGGGRQLLERPFNEVLTSGEPDFPFCLGWANHTWTGAWRGEDDRVLAHQTYPGKDDDLEHFRYMLSAFQDSRYLQVEDKPLFVIFQPEDIPDAAARLDRWRRMAVAHGLNGIFFVGLGVHPDERHKYSLDGTSGISHQEIKYRFNSKSRIYRLPVLLSKLFRIPELFPYRLGMKYFLPDGKIPLTEYPAIVTGWDNTPRYQHRGFVYVGYDPESFRRHVRQAVDRVLHKPAEHRILFLKSWNEWAEGNYIEPDQKYGPAFLEVLREEVVERVHWAPALI